MTGVLDKLTNSSNITSRPVVADREFQYIFLALATMGAGPWAQAQDLGQGAMGPGPRAWPWDLGAGPLAQAQPQDHGPGPSKKHDSTMKMIPFHQKQRFF